MYSFKTKQLLLSIMQFDHYYFAPYIESTKSMMNCNTTTVLGILDRNTVFPIVKHEYFNYESELNLRIQKFFVRKF